MNFLAHLYLSGDSDGVQTGNFIGDYVKGSHYNRYNGDIRKGILLHRAIDTFTDNHPAVGEAKSVFRPKYGRYAGIVTDVAFDHLLARRWEEFAECTLREFAGRIHNTLLSGFLNLPFRVQQFLPVMISNRRLESYASLEGTGKALAIMAKYSSLPDHSQFAVEAISHNQDQLNIVFSQFMKEITLFVESEYDIRIRRPGINPVNV